MMIRKELFGYTKDKEEVYSFTLENKLGTIVKIINYGATITSFIIKEDNCERDIVLGYDSISRYESGEKYFGATIGRNANRIKDSKIRVSGKNYNLKANEGPNQLHGGIDGFHKKIWQYEIIENILVMSYFSKDGEEGFPGNCRIKVSFLLNDKNQLIITYEGQSDKDTVFNPTNHSYFNLNGKGDIKNHYIEVEASEYLPINKDGTVTGEIKSVENTIFDLRKAIKIGEILESDNSEIKAAKGLDNNYCLNNKGKLELSSILYDDVKERRLLVYTDRPGVQVYTGNYIGNELGKENLVYGDYSGVCFETQYYPNSINISSFESSLLKAGEVFESTTIYEVQ